MSVVRLLSWTLVLALILWSGPLAGCANGPGGPTSGSDTTSDRAIPFVREGRLTFHSSRGLDSTVIDVEIAETDSARRRGLMERDSLPDRSGMLFIFEEERPRSFTMSNMDMAIDILFVGADRHVVSIARYARPGTPTIRSEAPARYVVETAAGFADRQGIVESDSVSWRRVQTASSGGGTRPTTSGGTRPTSPDR